MLCLEKSPSSDSTPSSVQVRKSSSSNPIPRSSVSSDSPKPPSSASDIPSSSSVSAQDLLNRRREADEPFRSPGSTDLGHGGGHGLAETGRSTSNLAISGSQQYLAGGKEPTPSIASDISNPYAAQELQLRLQQLQKYLSINQISIYLSIQWLDCLSDCVGNKSLFVCMSVENSCVCLASQNKITSKLTFIHNFPPGFVDKFKYIELKPPNTLTSTTGIFYHFSIDTVGGVKLCMCWFHSRWLSSLILLGKKSCLMLLIILFILHSSSRKLWKKVTMTQRCFWTHLPEKCWNYNVWLCL